MADVRTGSRVKQPAKAAASAAPLQTDATSAARSPRDLLAVAPAAWALLVLALIGLGISIFLTGEHYAGVIPACQKTGPINCGAVLTSSYSTVGNTNIPITVPGMLWFIVSGGLAAAAVVFAVKRQPAPEWLVPLHMVWSLVGLAFVLYLIYVEAFRLHEVCEWCSGVHLLVILTVVVATVRYSGFLRDRYART
ncbi:MAG TPA: vitamin K epoxide reductase family protein [Chloroflexota bacterium]|nr:vitamin K epoxide reductase family protein [Chloroflexota bacterium]